jgi:iron complex outermembrane receptor protein
MTMGGSFMSNHGVRYAYLVFGLIVGVGLVYSSDASAEVQVVTVTAQKREEIITEVPISMVALSGEALEEANIESVVELADHMPNLHIDSGVTQPSGSTLGMRGLNTSGGNGGVDPSVGVYLDGVYMPRPQSILRGLRDIQNVEVLRGPQGTLYGRNTPVGALNINTRKPHQEFEAAGEVGFGIGSDSAIGARNVFGMVNGGITDEISARVFAYRDRNHGYLKNFSSGARNSNEDYGGRISFLAEPNDDLDLLLAFDYDKTTIQCCAYEWIQVSPTTVAAQTQLNALRPGGFSNRGQANSKDGIVDEDAALLNNTKSYGISLKGDYEIGDHTITSITAYRNWHNISTGQGDGQPVKLLDFSGQNNSDKSFSEELRLTSPDDGIDFIEDTRLEYVVGFYYYRFHTINQTDLGFGVDSQYLPFFTSTAAFAGAPATPFLPAIPACAAPCPVGASGIGLATRDIYDANGWAVALFNQTTLHLTDRFSLTAGVRWSHDQKEASKTAPIQPAHPKLLNQLRSTPGNFSAKANSVTWLANARYFIIPEAFMVYFSTATGFKAPGINGSPDRAGGVPGTFQPEKSINFEVGTKANLFDQRLVVALSIYRTMIENLQVTIRNLTGLGTFATNAGKLRSQGVETSVHANPVDWLDLGAEVAHLDNRYMSFTNGPCYSNQPAGPNGYCDQTNRPNEKAPKWQADLSAKVEFPIENTPLNIWTRLNWTYVGGQYFDSDLDPRAFQSRYQVWNMAAGIKSEFNDINWEASIWVKNIANERHFTETADGLGGALLNSSGNPNSFLGNISPPRTMGVSLKVRY